MTTETSVNISQTITVPDAHILTLIEMAGYGIAYWAKKATLDVEYRTYTVHPDDEAQADDPEMRPRRLKFEWIAKRLVQLGSNPAELGFHPDAAVAKYARQYVGLLATSEAEYADGEIDSDLADAVLQLTFFKGKVVFS